MKFVVFAFVLFFKKSNKCSFFVLMAVTFVVCVSAGVCGGEGVAICCECVLLLPMMLGSSPFSRLPSLSIVSFVFLFRFFVGGTVCHFPFSLSVLAQSELI
uniref:Uncharacterized protein n=1 Tax=Octopus bimaculoides TaxID=37653 RepID=A0A0L8GYF9_OCTBM